MKKIVLHTSLFATAFVLSSNTQAQWSIDPAVNTPVCMATGNQIDLRMTSDGKGGAFISWKDYRNGLPDIYIQRLDKNGMPKWTVDGVALVTDPADQSTPSIVDDMHGGAIVGFSDWRSGIERDLYAQHVDSNGNILWQTDGAVVVNKTVREHNEKLCSDDSGGAIIIFEQQVSGQWDVWAQRIDYNGLTRWASGGVALTSVFAQRQQPKVQSDGKGGAYVSFQDFRNGTDYDIYAQHINKNGMPLWGTGLLIAGGSSTQINAKIDPDTLTGGCYICWSDKRNGLDYDIYCQRIDSAGNLMWPANGRAVCTAASNQSAIDILAEASIGGLIVTWKDYRFGSWDIYAQKLDMNGTAQWNTNGMVITADPGDQINPNIVGDHVGGAIIVWQDDSTGGWNAKAQHIDGSGLLTWNVAGGVPVGTAFGDQTSPKNCTDGAGGAIFAFEDLRSGFNSDVYAHHLYGWGTPFGVAEISNGLSALFQIAPNPTSGSVTIQLMTNNISQWQNESIVITDLFGRVVTSHLIVASKMNLDVSSFTRGIYFCRIGNDVVKFEVE